MTDIASFFGESRLGMDFFYMICEDRIGYGVSRTVYSCKPNPGWVVKFEANVSTFQNVLEWEIWQAIKDKPQIAKFFAPCHYISDNGIVLMQARTRPILMKEMPDMVPNFITDMDEKNWGILDGQPVLHDYGFTKLLSNGANAKLKKHDYHEEIAKARSRPG